MDNLANERAERLKSEEDVADLKTELKTVKSQRKVN